MFLERQDGRAGWVSEKQSKLPNPIDEAPKEESRVPGQNSAARCDAVSEKRRLGKTERMIMLRAKRVNA